MNSDGAISDALAHFKTVHIDDIDMAYQEIGAGKPLLMIMGYSYSMDRWSHQLIQALSISNRVIVFDNRGMGYSQSSEKEYSIPLFASDTVGLLDALKIERANVLGYSMGTFIAQEIALTRPERVNKLVLIAGSVGGKEGIPAGPKGMDVLTNRSGTDEERMIRGIEGLFPTDWLKQHPDISSYYPIARTFNPQDRVLRQAQAVMHWAGSSSRLGQMNLPTLIFAGDSDILVPPENAMILARSIANSWLIRIRNCGHGVIYQYPKLIADEIALFL
ncbi:MAG: alpha/beta hydrolase [Spirochaetia bacterium]|jgi:pimeloyl-ACP methyl ester carboxylesterase